MAFRCDGKLLGSIQHILVFKAEVLGQLVNSDFAAAGHSVGVSDRAGRGVPRCPHAKSGQCLVCLSGFTSACTEPLIQRREDCIRHLTSQSFLQPFSAPSLLKALFLRTEIGRAAHPEVQKDPILVVTDHPPKVATILELAACHATTEDGLGAHRASSRVSASASSLAAVSSSEATASPSASSTASPSTNSAEGSSESSLSST